jgi:signal transduction protein with GAF and PtsI domain
LGDIAAMVAEQLERDGIETVVVGPSAAASHAANVCEITEIDFAVPTGVSRKSVAESIAKLGFRPRGRLFVREGASYELHFSSGPGERIVKRAVTIESDAGSYRALAAIDAIVDCAAGFVHWEDRRSLEAAECFTHAMRERIIDSRLLEALHDIEASDADGRRRLDFAEGRLKAALR